MNKEHIKQLAKMFCDAEFGTDKIAVIDLQNNEIMNPPPIYLLERFIERLIEKGEVVSKEEHETGINLFIDLLKRYNDLKESTVSSAGNEVIESCERAKWLMVNRLFPTEEYGEHPDVCELYEIIEDIQKSSPASTASPAKVVSDDDIQRYITAVHPDTVGNRPLQLLMAEKIRISLEWMREQLTGNP